jgi:3-oxosteroid 1-dehydrogenase
VDDNAERARRYFDAAVTYDGPGTTPARRDAFLHAAPKMIDFLERAGMKFVYADGWSDYYDELPGGEPRGRSLLAELFDTRELGAWESKLSRYKGLRLAGADRQFPDLMLVKRTMKGKRRAAALAWRLLKSKLTGERLARAGAAIQGRMLQIALREQCRFGSTRRSAN